MSPATACRPPACSDGMSIPSRMRVRSSTRSVSRVGSSRSSRPTAGERPAGHALGVGGRMLRVPPAHAADVAVRAGADAPPVVAAPVAEVVARAVRGIRRPVAHLVPLVARGAEELVGELVHVGLEVVVGLGELAAADLPGELRAVLDDEGVGAHVVGALRDDRVDAAPPVGERLPRRAVDEVEADVEAGVARPAARRAGCARDRACGRGRRARAAPPTACRTRPA